MLAHKYMISVYVELSSRVEESSFRVELSSRVFESSCRVELSSRVIESSYRVELLDILDKCRVFRYDKYEDV